MRRRSAACAAAFMMLAAAGCGEKVSEGPVSFTIAGDSIIEMVVDTLENGSITVDCPVTLTGTAEAPEGSTLSMRTGRIRYVWWQTGAEAGSYEYTPESLHAFWFDSVFSPGDSRQTHPHGFGQSAPAQPVRGEIVFEYGPTRNPESQETETFRFYCY